MLKAALAKLRSLKPTRETLARFGLLAVVVAAFGLPVVAHAADGWMASATDWVLGELAALILLAVRGIGYIMLMLVQGLIQVLQYTNFTNPGPTAVQIGWVVTRDLSNMFFIVMLMVIALSTAIGWPENYHYSKQLRSLLIIAVMINFSKTITGLIIDMGQVIMMTFVNGIADAAGGNFLNAFQIGKLLQLKSAGAGASATDAAGLVLGAALALVMVIIATCVILALLVMMVYRIVYLWVLIIMSPIAFLSRAVPPFASKYAEWWKELKQYVISGPTAAFFIWLALMIGQVSGGQVAQSSGIGLANGTAGSTEAQSLASSSGVTGIPTEAGQTDVFLSMIITTALLLAGMKEASKSGFDLGVASYATKKLKGAGNAMKSFAYRNTAGRALDVGRYAGGYAARGVATLGGKASSVIGGQVGRVPVVGTVLAGRSRAAILRQEADQARKAGDTEKATKLEGQARRADFAAKVTAPVRGVVAGVTGAAAVGAAAGAHRSYQDEQRAKAINEAGKKLSVEDALAVTTGKRPAKNEAERNAAYKKAIESGRADQGVVAEGRKALQGTADHGTIEAYEKSAAEKHGLYFKKDGTLDNDKRKAKLAEGEINFRTLSRSGKQAMINEIAPVSTTSDPKLRAEEMGRAKAALRSNNVPADVISTEMAAKNPALAQYVLERTSTNPEERLKAMNRTGKDENGQDIKMSDVLQKAAMEGLAETLENTKSSGRQIADALKEAVMTGAQSLDDIKKLPEREQQAVATSLNIPNLAKAAEGMAPDDPRVGALQGLVAIVMANSNEKRQHDIQNNDRNVESNILPDAATIASFTPLSGNSQQPATVQQADAAPQERETSSQPPPSSADISGAVNQIQARLAQLNQTLSAGPSPLSDANESEKAQLETLNRRLSELSSAISFNQQKLATEHGLGTPDQGKIAQLETEISNLGSELRKAVTEARKA